MVMIALIDPAGRPVRTAHMGRVCEDCDNVAIVPWF